MPIPQKAKDEILERLSTQLSISSDEMAEILRRHHVKQNTAALQRSYRKRMGQQYLASFRDSEGKREILAVPDSRGGMEYVVIDGCNDQKKLKHIQRRLGNQMVGLDHSTQKVKDRFRVLNHFWKKEA